jgi:hypothetical protein
MNKDKLKFLIKEVILEKNDENLINAAISYLVKNEDLDIKPSIMLFAKAILCDKRNGRKHDYSKISKEGFNLAKLATDKSEEISNMDPELFREMVRDGSKRKYRKLIDLGDKIITIGE